MVLVVDADLTVRAVRYPVTDIAATGGLDLDVATRSEAPMTDRVTWRRFAQVSIYDIAIGALSGGPANLDQYRDKDPAHRQRGLQVRPAAPQYAALQHLSEAYSPRGLVVLGVPCNQFGGQEPGTATRSPTSAR